MYPAPKELREDFDDLRRQQGGSAAPSPLHALGKVDVNGEIALKRQLAIIGVSVFCACLILVALNAYSRDSNRAESEDKVEVMGNDPKSFGPGASVAAETTFPTVTPTAYGGMETRPSPPIEQRLNSQLNSGYYNMQSQCFQNNLQSPSYHPAGVHGVSLPVQDTLGVRMKRFVTR